MVSKTPQPVRNEVRGSRQGVDTTDTLDLLQTPPNLTVEARNERKRVLTLLLLSVGDYLWETVPLLGDEPELWERHTGRLEMAEWLKDKIMELR